MKRYNIHLAVTLLAILLGATSVAGQDSQDSKDTKDKSSGSSTPWYSPSKYNPMKLVKRYKSANDELASDGHLEDRLTKQLRLQGLLGENKELQVVCSDFRDLPNCIAVLRLTHSLQLEFTCLKWNVTGVKPKSVADSCAGPAGGKAMPLNRALDLLKPDVDSTKEASNALKKAHDDIRDARA
ncbi:MAG: hypothetical protein DMG35_19760 [Acidobacteria bacterium]|nr:MAG: hypothetical protein DMG35_19760 [Acidobacteriota bacterium]